MCDIIGRIEWRMAGLDLGLGQQAEYPEAAGEVDGVAQHVDLRSRRSTSDALPSLPDVLLHCLERIHVGRRPLVAVQQLIVE